jgi:hypothetical protein
MNYREGYDAWVPKDTTMGERGVFFQKCWNAAHTANNLMKQVTRCVGAHEKWANSHKSANSSAIRALPTDATCLVPVPAFCGTIPAVTACAATGGSFVIPQKESIMTLPFVIKNIATHVLVQKRLIIWKSIERTQFRCPRKERNWKKIPRPKIDYNFQKTPRYTTKANINGIIALSAQANAAAIAIQPFVIAAQTATGVAMAANMASMAAFPLEPATFVAINLATKLWKIAKKMTEKAKQLTFDLTHEALTFERGRIASCNMPVIDATKYDIKNLHSYGAKLKDVPEFLKFDDNKRGPGHPSD